MRDGLALTLCTAWLLVFGGCRDGHIKIGRTPPDESAVFYSTSDRGPLQVTDSRGTRTLTSFGDYEQECISLSRDGRWALLVIWDARKGANWPRAGDRLLLVETRTCERYRARLPFNLAPVAHEPGLAAFKRQERIPDEHDGLVVPTGVAPLPAFIESLPRVWFGPINDSYFVWSPNNVGAMWETRPAAAGAPPEESRADRGLMYQEHPREPVSPYIVVIPFDGWNARRTVWVRPDCTVVELTRQNDGPLKPGQLFVGFLGSMVPSNLGGPLQALVYWPYVAAKTPEAIEKQSERDRSELVVARERLQRAIELRRAAASEAAVSRPVADAATRAPN